MSMRILIIGDIVGSPGRAAFARLAGQARANDAVDFIIANAENAAGGRGLTPAVAAELLQAGADVLTLGDHAWDQKEIVGYIDREPRVLRPANFAPGNPGRGWNVYETPKGRVTVINLVGRVFLPPADCPFRTVQQILDEPSVKGTVTIVDLHAEATSEKIAMGWFLDGRVSALAGSHTHVQTADERILPRGTAFLTDLGMCGARRSVLGRDIESVLQKFVTGRPSVFKVAEDDVWVEGVWIMVDEKTGRALRIKRIQVAAGRENEEVSHWPRGE